MLAVSTIKISVLLYYARLFPTKKFRLAVNIVMAYLLVWLIAFFFAFIFQCTPVSQFWNQTGTGTCGQLIELYLGNGFTSLVSDVVLMVLPLPMIWSLRIRLFQKILLSGVFMLGGLYAIPLSLLVFNGDVP